MVETGTVITVISQVKAGNDAVMVASLVCGILIEQVSAGKLAAIVITLSVSPVMEQVNAGRSDSIAAPV
jgi:hypothetical protein